MISPIYHTQPHYLFFRATKELNTLPVICLKDDLMKYFIRHKRKCILASCNLLVAFFLISFSGCIAGADYENRTINVYRTTGPKVL
ncbi:MAG: hypothetical protein QNL93_00745, partial [Opitutae bacterium]